MKDKIEVGEYVRTEIGTIGKVKTIHNAGSGVRFYGEDLYKNYYTIDYNENTYGRFDDYGITKHSKNILDLIEVGDLLHIKIRNAHEFIYYILDEDYLKMVKQNTKGDEWWKIKSIVTHEQFNEMEYRINE